jgi:excisionase family DNA binding protein
MLERLMQLLEQIATELDTLNTILASKDLKNDDDRTMFPKEAAEYLGISYDSLLRWAREGKIPSSQPGGQRVLFRKKALDAWLEEQERQRIPNKGELKDKQYGRIRKIKA